MKQNLFEKHLQDIPHREGLWHEYSMIKAGTGRNIFWQPSSVPELRRLIVFAKENALPVRPLGLGSNLIGSDRDFAVLAVDLRKLDEEKLRCLSPEDGEFHVSAALSLPMLASSVVKYGFGGLAPLSGIPASVGGALRMNAGAKGSSIGQFVRRIYGLNLEDGSDFQQEYFPSDWSYRHSPVSEQILITGADLVFPAADSEEEQALIQAEHQRRRECTPPGLSCGSVFRNPPDLPPAGKLLEDCGCKELPACGVFSVSRQHANWIVNLTKQPGSAADCLQLMQLMQEKVREAFNITLLPEWRIVGHSPFSELNGE